MRAFPFSKLHGSECLWVMLHSMWVMYHRCIRITCALCVCVDDRVAHPTDRRRGDNYGLHSRLLYSCVQFATCALSVSQITQLDLRIIRPSTTNPPRDHSFTSAKVPVQFDSLRIGFRSIPMIVSVKTRRAFKCLKIWNVGIPRFLIAHSGSRE